MSIRLFLVLAVSLPFNSNAQITNNIKKVGTLNIYGKGKTIIGQIIINQTLETKVFLTGVSQSKDTTDNTFFTVLSFDNKAKIPMFGVDINLVFDKPVLSAGYDASAISAYQMLSGDKMYYSTQIGQVNRMPERAPLKLGIKSKEPVFIKISGVDGILE